MKTTLTDEEQKEAAAAAGETPNPNAHLFDYSSEDTATRNTLLDRFELIKVRKVDMNAGSGIAIIFNPYVSGNRMDEIQGLFYDRGVTNEIIVCESNLDPFRKVYEMENLSGYSALIAVGGDGTFNQMVNGMLARPDK